ncbi:hypothetical protein ASPZODRAFT_126538 [Penicilliopsis zonata CBS 506.65]|uniref:Uncharacterized protein n=1 Tax=Penicilliopsis zonata CBS 506.65 TaxID=1073090 RepID=A0A1L9STW8_9EURO|nr:hypothetical protein ASPZODRAFT_126538 [Penicilliopsis zonata CBS 506.65]OJJ50639.1 hypothetical protein ASPZODRAFT_126538 [Penicilliopsis zonata CBS 506.65]
MSSTTTSAAAASSSCGSIYVMPITDAACALPASGNNSAIMSQCCKDAPVTKYDDDCAFYCLAEGQTIGNLTSCITSNGGTQVFCNNSNQTATATASVSSSSSTGTSTSTGTKTGSSASSTSSSAAMVNQPVSKTGLGLLAMFFCSAVAAVVA